MTTIVKKILTSLVLLLLLLFNGCFRGSVWGNGNRVTVERSVDSFSNIRSDFVGDVYITQGAEQKVSITGDSNLLEIITLDVRDGLLIIDSTKNYTISRRLLIEITVPDLDSVTVKGVSDIEMVNFETEQLILTTDGVGSIEASGRVENLTATVHGVGDLELKDLISQNVTAVVKGVGSIDVYADKTMDLRVDGVGDINYFGDAVINFLEDDGIGSIKKGD